VPVERLTIDDYSDRELLLVLEDVADGDGWADAQDVADRLDLAKRAIASSRLAWLKRFGAVEREHERDEAGVLRYTASGKPVHTQRWRLTAAGRALAHGRLRKRDETTLDSMGDEQMLLVTRWLSQRTVDEGTTAKLVQREWRFGHARQRRVA
jgi:predicted ArsR family transcriptional regulator